MFYFTTIVGEVVLMAAYRIRPVIFFIEHAGSLMKKLFIRASIVGILGLN